MSAIEVQPQSNKLFFALKRYADQLDTYIIFISEKKNEVKISLSMGELVFFVYYIAAGDEEYSIPGIGLSESVVNDEKILQFIAKALHVSTEALLHYIDLGYLPEGILGARFPLTKIKLQSI